MPLVREGERRRNAGWHAAVLAVLVALALLASLGAFAAYLMSTSRPVILGDWALTGPHCWVEEPAPNFTSDVRPSGTVDVFEERFRVGGYGLYRRESGLGPGAR